MKRPRKKKHLNPIHELAKKNPPEDRKLEPSDSPLADALGVEDPRTRGVAKMVEGFFEAVGGIVSKPGTGIVSATELARARRSRTKVRQEGIAVCKHGVFECMHCVRERKGK